MAVTKWPERSLHWLARYKFLATLIIRRVCVCLSVRNFDAKYLGN